MYRIIRQTRCNEIVYKVQRKVLWLWWSTESMVDISFGSAGNSYDLTFSTIEEAEEYICKHYHQPKFEIVKVINYE